MRQEQEQETEPKELSIRETLLTEFPDIEEETLQIYESLEQDSPQLLYPPTSEPNNETIAKYTSIHSKIHEEIAELIVNQKWDVLVLESGMFGGKTSLSYKILAKMKSLGYLTKLFIADLLGEAFITARSYQDGERVRIATRFGKIFPRLRLPLKETYIRNKDGKLRKVRNNKRVVILDEFSFLDRDSLKRIISKCRNDNVKLILTGLSRNHLGDDLAPFKDLESLVGKNCLRVNCKSFVPGIDGDEPTGTHTVRYIKLGEKEILDLGLLPDIVSKEEENKSKEKIVRYTSAKEYMTFISIFKNNPEILEFVLYPSEEQKRRRGDRFENLKNR